MAAGNRRSNRKSSEDMSTNDSGPGGPWEVVVGGETWSNWPSARNAEKEARRVLRLPAEVLPENAAVEIRKTVGNTAPDESMDESWGAWR
jgi:hypothetical protein